MKKDEEQTVYYIHVVQKDTYLEEHHQAILQDMVNTWNIRV